MWGWQFSDIYLIWYFGDNVRKDGFLLDIEKGVLRSH